MKRAMSIAQNWFLTYRLEVTGLLGLACISYGTSLIYQPLPYLIVGSTMCTLSILAARKGI
jgi:hypothetical protein